MGWNGLEHHLEIQPLPEGVILVFEHESPESFAVVFGFQKKSIVPYNPWVGVKMEEGSNDPKRFFDPYLQYAIEEELPSDTCRKYLSPEHSILVTVRKKVISGEPLYIANINVISNPETMSGTEIEGVFPECHLLEISNYLYDCYFISQTFTLEYIFQNFAA